MPLRATDYPERETAEKRGARKGVKDENDILLGASIEPAGERLEKCSAKTAPNGPVAIGELPVRPHEPLKAGWKAFDNVEGKANEGKSQEPCSEQPYAARVTCQWGHAQRGAFAGTRRRMVFVAWK
jgi:hypothetical protein